MIARPVVYVYALSLVLTACSMQSYKVAKPDLSSTQTTPATASPGQSEDESTGGAITKPEESTTTPSTNNTPTPTATNAPPAVPVAATGSVSVNLTVMPPTPAGTYRNRGHIRSVWVTDANDKYLKTIHAFAGQRSIHLKRWQALDGNIIDGATGATQITPAAGGVPVAATWDLKDKAGVLQMTGNYKLWMEYTEANTPALDVGKKPSDPAQAIDAINGYEYLVVPFTVTPTGSAKTDSSNAVFKDVAVKHIP